MFHSREFSKNGAPKFDANLIKSVAFIAKFKVSVYEEVYLKNIQKLICLMKHIKEDQTEILRYI